MTTWCVQGMTTLQIYAGRKEICREIIEGQLEGTKEKGIVRKNCRVGRGGVNGSLRFDEGAKEERDWVIICEDFRDHGLRV